MSGRTPPPGSMGPWTGGGVTARAHCVLAPNPGPMTLDGTNTWILLEPGADRAIVIDPGPNDPAHLGAVRATIDEFGARIDLILLTHGHTDHSASAKSFAAELGVGVRALDPGQRLGSEGLADGDVIGLGGLELHVTGTPGHSSDSLCFTLPADAALLTGDTILGRGTTVVAAPDGDLGDYLDSLERLREIAGTTASAVVLPGHGPVLSDPVKVIDHYLTHRAERLEQVRTALVGLDPALVSAPTIPLPPERMTDGSTGGVSLGEGDDPDPLVETVVRIVYAGVDEVLWPAARRSTRAQLHYLRTR